MSKKPLSVDPRLPVVLSLLVPGGGQFAQRRFFMGAVFQIGLSILFIAIVIGFVINGVHLFKVMQKGHEPSIGILFHGMIFPTLGLFAIYVWNLVDAHVATVRMKKNESS